MTFEPEPIDTKGVSLNETEQGLVEMLAQNAHHVWARQRMSEGWVHGPERDDSRRVTNLLVPYEQLSEAEQELNRRLVRQTLTAAKAKGWALKPAAPPPLSPEERRRLDQLETYLHEQGSTATRTSDFDMDDGPELAAGVVGESDILTWALGAQSDVLLPAWRAKDAEAVRLHKLHRIVARAAITSGVLALVFAVVQLLMGGGPGWWMEGLAILAAAIAVGAGLVMKFHHGWLSARQAAERLRNHKFSSLADPLLWTDRDAWRVKLVADVEALARVDSEAAGEWARRAVHGHRSHQEEPQGPADVPALSTFDLHALSRYYQAKRHGHQRAYFNRRLAELNEATWPLRLHLPVWIFFGSVVCVAVHLILHLYLSNSGQGSAILHDVEHWALGAAVILPILGFGMRAWFAAFETPRRALLFEAKRNAVDGARSALRSRDLTGPALFAAMRESEQLFETEHREWCRLQFAAEWFL